MKFIDRINEHDDNAFMVDYSPSFKFVRNELIGNSQISTDKASYLKFVNDIFKKIDDTNDRIYWGYLIQVSCGRQQKLPRKQFKNC